MVKSDIEKLSLIEKLRLRDNLNLILQLEFEVVIKHTIGVSQYEALNWLRLEINNFLHK